MANPYFNPKSSNGQVRGTSEMYSQVSDMENGIASVEKNSSGASVKDNL